MRPTRIFSLLLVLCTILVAPAVITSCSKASAQTEQFAQSNDETTAAYAELNKTQTVTPTADLTQDIGAILVPADGLFSWQNIAVLILGILSTFFAVLWKRATKVIEAINQSLQDGKIDKKELQRIIAAWKG